MTGETAIETGLSGPNLDGERNDTELMRQALGAQAVNGANCAAVKTYEQDDKAAVGKAGTATRQTLDDIEKEYTSLLPGEDLASRKELFKKRDILVQQAVEMYEKTPRVRNFINSLVVPEVDILSDDLEYDETKVYLRSISQYKVLEPAKQRKLLQQLQPGLQLLDRRYDLENLSPEEEQMCIDLVQARQALYCCNMALAVSVAKNYVSGDTDMLIIDYSQEGGTGLAKAINRFDLSKGYEFSTYSTKVMHSAIQRAKADQSRTIRVPRHVDYRWRKLRMQENELTRRLKRNPSPAELAEYTGRTPEDIRSLNSAGQRRIASLDAPLGDTKESDTLGDVLVDESSSSMQVFAAELLDKEEVNGLLALAKERKLLTPREIAILCLRYGFYSDSLSTDSFEIINEDTQETETVDYKELMRRFEVKKYEKAKKSKNAKNHQQSGKPSKSALKLTEVSAVIGVGRERIRQLEERALNKLKNLHESEL